MSTITGQGSAAAPEHKAASASPLYRLAWRNIWRSKRRTGLLVAVVAYASLATIFFWGITDGVSVSVLNNQARYMLAPALVTTTAYQDDPDPENALASLDITSEIESVSGVRGSAPRLEFFGLLRSPYTSESAVVRGIDPSLEPQVSNIPGGIAEGRMLENASELVLGKELAERIDVRVGERLAVDTSSLAGPQALGLRVVGLIETGIVAVDQGTVLIHIDDARSLTGVETATAIALDIPRGQEAAITEQVGTKLPADLGAYDLMTLLGPVADDLNANAVSLLPIAFLFALFAALAVTSTLLVSVIERNKELGMMASIGLAPKRLSRMMVLEAIAVTILGWVVGLILGYGINWIFGTWNILGPAFSASSESFASYGLGDEFYAINKPVYALYATATIVFAAVLAVLIPARRVAKLKPVEAMRDG